MTARELASKAIVALMIGCAVLAALVARPYIQRIPAEDDWIRQYFGFSSEQGQFTFVAIILIAWIVLSCLAWMLGRKNLPDRLIDSVMTDRLTQITLLSMGAGILGLFASIARFVSVTH